MNRTNPCQDCRLKDKDKNNITCRKCDKRLSYLEGLAGDLEFSAALTVDHGYPLHLPH